WAPHEVTVMVPLLEVKEPYHRPLVNQSLKRLTHLLENRRHVNLVPYPFSAGSLGRRRRRVRGRASWRDAVAGRRREAGRGLEHSCGILPGVSSEGRIVAADLGEDDSDERSLRPKRLEEFPGQDRIKENIAIAVEAALARGEALD